MAFSTLRTILTLAALGTALLIAFVATLIAAFTILVAVLVAMAITIAIARLHVAAFAIAGLETIAAAATAPEIIVLIVTVVVVLLAAFVGEFRIRLIADALRTLALRVGVVGAAIVVVEILLARAEAVGDWRRRRKRRLAQAPETEIMLGVLEIILAHHAIARGGRISRQLQIAFVDVGCRSTDFNVRAVALHGAVRVVSTATTTAPAAWLATIATTSALTLIMIFHYAIRGCARRAPRLGRNPS